jgi:hypothetical protein
LESEEDAAMAAIPVMIEDELYVKAEQRAAALHTSVPDVVADYLREWVAAEDDRAAARESMRKRFANPDWTFSVGELEDRERRNARR